MFRMFSMSDRRKDFNVLVRRHDFHTSLTSHLGDRRICGQGFGTAVPKRYSHIEGGRLGMRRRTDHASHRTNGFGDGSGRQTPRTASAT
jgi:hypothetical protein